MVNNTSGETLRKALDWKQWRNSLRKFCPEQSKLRTSPTTDAVEMESLNHTILQVQGTDEMTVDEYNAEWYRISKPLKIWGLWASLALNLIGCTLGLTILVLRVWKAEWKEASVLIGIHVACGLILLTLGQTGSGLPQGKKSCCGLLAECLKNIFKLLCMSFYVWKALRCVKYFKEKKDLIEKFKIPLRSRQQVQQSEIQCVARTRELQLRESDVDRIEHSIRNISIALASIYFHFDTKTDWDDCTAKDAWTLFIVMVCIVLTSYKALSYENDYHELPLVLHFHAMGLTKSSDRIPYSRYSWMERTFSFICHFLRVGTKIRVIGHLLVLHPVVAGFITGYHFLYTVIVHHLLDLSGYIHVPPLLRYTNFKKLIYVDHFLSTSPSTLLCSFKSIGPMQKISLVLCKDIFPLIICEAALCWYTMSSSHPVVVNASSPCLVDGNWTAPFRNDSSMDSLGIIRNAVKQLNVFIGNVWPVLLWICENSLGLYIMCILLYASGFSQYGVGRSSDFPLHVKRMIFRKVLELDCEGKFQIRKVLFFTLTTSQTRGLRIDLNSCSRKFSQLWNRNVTIDPIDNLLGTVVSEFKLDISETEEIILRGLENLLQSKELGSFVKSLTALGSENDRRVSYLLSHFARCLDIRMKEISSTQLFIILDHFDVPIQQIMNAVIEEIDKGEEASEMDQTDGRPDLIPIYETPVNLTSFTGIPRRRGNFRCY